MTTFYTPTDNIYEAKGELLSTPDLWYDLGSKLTCREVEALAVVVATYLDAASAVRLLIGHAFPYNEEEEEEDGHYGAEALAETLTRLGFEDFDDLLPRA